METPRWVTDSVFYQIFPDRFAQSRRLDRSGLNLEAWEAAPTAHGMKGGDLFGVAEHLDYLADLGINALYLCPVFSSASNHRYHTYDYYQVDPILGGNQALRELLDKAHDRGMRVILDGAFNHASRGFWQFHHTLENGADSPYLDWFHFDPDRLAGRRPWGAYPSADELQAIDREGSLRAIGYQGWWNLPALPKFNTQTPAVREFLFGVAEHWIRFGIDGWRLDVPAEIDDDDFWREFRRRVRQTNPEAYIVGEIWHEAGRWLRGDQFDASMNYPLTAACIGFFPGQHLDLAQAMHVGGFHGQLQAMDAKAFADRIDWCRGLYDADVTRVQFNVLDSHDTPRFLTNASGDVSSLQLGLTFLLTYPGAPCLFYGDEIGMTGGQEPDCRRSFLWSEDAWNREILSFTRNLIRSRHSRRSLRWGEFGRLYSADQVYAFQRRLEDERTVVVLNVSEDDRENGLEVPSPAGTQPAVLSGQAEILKGDSLRLRIQARTGVVLGVDGHLPHT
jgi:cyclomaltodextrinase